MVKRRKIPVRHHHGIRDPLQQREEREKKLKNVTNNPPEKDGQKLSRTFMQFKKLADAAKSGKLPKRFSAGREDVPRTQKAGKVKAKPESERKIKFVKPLPGEEDKDYLRRVNRMTSESLKEAQYEAKYGVRVVRNAKTGEIKIEKKPKNEIDELLKKREKDRLLAKRGKHKRNQKETVETEKMDPKTAKELIKQVLREEKSEKRKEIKPEFERETFKFGEVVHAPPTLKTIPRKAQKADTVSRPGSKKNLLLQTLLTEQPASSVVSVKKKQKTASSLQGITKAQLKGKRKELPVGTRDMLEKERTKFVELYRNLKREKESSKLNT